MVNFVYFLAIISPFQEEFIYKLLRICNLMVPIEKSVDIWPRYGQKLGDYAHVWAYVFGHNIFGNFDKILHGTSGYCYLSILSGFWRINWRGRHAGA